MSIFETIEVFIAGIDYHKQFKEELCLTFHRRRS